jgi:hypothetical protein
VMDMSILISIKVSDYWLLCGSDYMLWVGPCHRFMARPQVVDGGAGSRYVG